VTLFANLCATVLKALGFPQETGVVSTVMQRADPTVIVLAVVVVAPIAEELFFRGVVFNAWEREYGTRVAVFGSAALFALIHGSLVQLLPIFVLGIGLALLYRWTRSLPATMAMHAGFNAVTVTIVLLDRLGVLKLPT
jgi:membrane protease YdiL (CAAX protease family)